MVASSAHGVQVLAVETAGALGEKGLHALENFFMFDTVNVGQLFDRGKPLVDVVRVGAREVGLLFSCAQKVLVVLGRRVVAGDVRRDGNIIVVIGDQARRIVYTTEGTYGGGHGGGGRADDKAGTRNRRGIHGRSRRGSGRFGRWGRGARGGLGKWYTTPESSELESLRVKQLSKLGVLGLLCRRCSLSTLGTLI